MFLRTDIRTRVRQIDLEISEYRVALKTALLAGAESATQASAGASQSYKRWNPQIYRDEITRLLRERQRLIWKGKKRTSPDFGGFGAPE